jgi:hypothetical protein
LCLAQQQICRTTCSSFPASTTLLRHDAIAVSKGQIAGAIIRVAILGPRTGSPPFAKFVSGSSRTPHGVDFLSLPRTEIARSDLFMAFSLSPSHHCRASTVTLPGPIPTGPDTDAGKVEPEVSAAVHSQSLIVFSSQEFRNHDVL